MCDMQRQSCVCPPIHISAHITPLSMACLVMQGAGGWGGAAGVGGPGEELGQAEGAVGHRGAARVRAVLLANLRAHAAQSAHCRRGACSGRAAACGAPRGLPACEGAPAACANRIRGRSDEDCWTSGCPVATNRARCCTTVLLSMKLHGAYVEGLHFFATYAS